MDPRTAKMLAEREQNAASAPPTLTGAPRINQGLKAWIRAHQVLAAVAAGAALVVWFGGYHVLVALPAQRQEELEFQARAVERVKVETAARQAAVDTCLANTKTETDARWDQACKARKRRAGCALPEAHGEALERQESQSRNACLLMRSSVDGQ